jgi:hypothetical protein
MRIPHDLRHPDGGWSGLRSAGGEVALSEEDPFVTGISPTFGRIPGIFYSTVLISCTA